MFLLFKNRPNDDDPVVFQIIDLYIYSNSTCIECIGQLLNLAELGVESG